MQAARRDRRAQHLLFAGGRQPVRAGHRRPLRAPGADAAKRWRRSPPASPRCAIMQFMYGGAAGAGSRPLPWPAWRTRRHHVVRRHAGRTQEQPGARNPGVDMADREHLRPLGQGCRRHRRRVRHRRSGDASARRSMGAQRRLPRHQAGGGGAGQRRGRRTAACTCQAGDARHPRSPPRSSRRSTRSPGARQPRHRDLHAEHQRPQEDPRLPGRGAGARARPQHQGQLQRAARRRPHHDRAAARQHRPVLVDPLAGRRAGAVGVRRDQGGHPAAGARRGVGVRPVRRPRQLRRARA